jgi:para-aminobenzoate synthetase
VKTLLVDNHDSYTYNVFHLLAAASGEEPMVVNNDGVSWRVLTRMDFDAIVLSPGPGHPSRWHDFGVCSDILRHSEIPVFGICLGHQGIGNLLDGTVNRAPMAMHGRLSRVMHEGKGLFKDVPQGFSVVRYHSLAITSPPGPEGSIVAWSDDGVVMGVEHTKRPIWGVQFHPESISTEYGLKIAQNFFELAAQHRCEAERPAGRATIAPQSAPRSPAATSAEGGEMELRMRTIPGQAPTEHVYERLFADADTSFWLDSADVARPVLLHGDDGRRRPLHRHLRRRQR